MQKQKHQADHDEPDAPSMESLLEEVEEENDLSKVIATLLDPKNLKHLTDLSQEEITAFSTLGTMAAKYKIELLQQWLLENLALRVSKTRSGRREFVRITQRFADPPSEPRRGLMDFRR